MFFIFVNNSFTYNCKYIILRQGSDKASMINLLHAHSITDTRLYIDIILHFYSYINL